MILPLPSVLADETKGLIGTFTIAMIMRDTVNPSRAIRSAIARPIPLLHPVTRIGSAHCSLTLIDS